MNFNPLVFSYKDYPKSKLATIVNCLSAFMQRMFILCAVMFALLGSICNLWEVLMMSAGMFLLWFFLKRNKDKWSDKIAAKQESIDNFKNENL